MPNPLYDKMKQNNQCDSIEAMFSSFMEQFRGQNPNAIIEQLVQSGKLSQSQLNAIQAKGKEMTRILEPFRKKFNF